MNYAQIRKYDIANGPGVRTTIFLTGCTLNCKNCFNKEYQNFHFGKVFDEKAFEEVMDCLSDANISGLSVLGGEPFDNLEGLKEFITKVRAKSEKDIWIYSGYTFEELLEKDGAMDVLKNIDVLVDGRFVEDLKDLKLKFRGSSNQRIIDMKRTLEEDEILLMDKYMKED
ncbi:anaerobic ribonucleoside-triphosphate reductase activating protein [Peptostreptococcaceae bacterium oral taxon 929]|nr:anaerobic ribonucleoside-triphosphate reductase activating protein [Peptostreptococcaceae bacterium oral taxon 929]